MRVLGEDEGGVPARRGLVSAILDSSARLLEAEQDRWMLWVPVLFAAGILTYFALADEPGLRLALALLIVRSGSALRSGTPRSDCASGAPRSHLPRASPSPSSAPRWCVRRFSRKSFAM
jgi:hypothetical protein